MVCWFILKQAKTKRTKEMWPSTWDSWLLPGRDHSIRNEAVGHQRAALRCFRESNHHSWRRKTLRRREYYSASQLRSVYKTWAKWRQEAWKQAVVSAHIRVLIFLVFVVDFLLFFFLQKRNNLQSRQALLTLHSVCFLKKKKNKETKHLQ